jgi:hypothetical protein
MISYTGEFCIAWIGIVFYGLADTNRVYPFITIICLGCNPAGVAGVLLLITCLYVSA